MSNYPLDWQLCRLIGVAKGLLSIFGTCGSSLYLDLPRINVCQEGHTGTRERLSRSQVAYSQAIDLLSA